MGLPTIWAALITEVRMDPSVGVSPTDLAYDAMENNIIIYPKEANAYQNEINNIG